MALRPLAVLVGVASLAGCTLIDLSQLGGGSGAGQTGGASSAGNGPSGGSPETGGGPSGGSSGVTQGGGPQGGAPLYDECLLQDQPALYFRLDSPSDATTETNLGTLAGAGNFTGSHELVEGLVGDSNPSTRFTDLVEDGRLSFDGAQTLFGGFTPFSIELWLQLPPVVTTTSLVSYTLGHLLELRVVAGQGWGGSDAIELRFVVDGTLDERGVTHFLDPKQPDPPLLHIVAVYRQTATTAFNLDHSADDMLLYVNGESFPAELANGDEIAMPTFTSSVVIGNGFAGSLDEVAVYPRELSAAEVARHYAFGLDAALGCDGE